MTLIAEIDYVPVYLAAIAAASAIGVKYLDWRLQSAVNAAKEDAALKAEKIRADLVNQTAVVKRDLEIQTKQVNQATTANAVKIESQVQNVQSTLARVDGEKTAALDELLKMAVSIQALVNGKWTIQLRLTAVALRRLAELTRLPEDIAAAVLAEKLLSEHIAQQSAADS